MKRKLFTQMRHEWRANTWMLVELVIVSTALWVIFSILFPVLAPLFRPVAYTADDLYGTAVRIISPKDPRYKPYDDTLHSYVTDARALLARLRNNPHVVEVGLGTNLRPYSMSFYGTSISTLNPDSLGYVMINRRSATPEAIRALGIKGAHGQDNEDLVRVLESGRVLLAASDNYDADMARDVFLDKRIIISRDSSMVYTVGAIIPLYPRNHFEETPYMTLIKPYNEDVDVYDFPDLTVRVKPGEGKQFLNSLTTDDYELGNVYMMPIKSFKHVRDESQIEASQMIRNYLVCMVFLLICAFMGLFGTFWLRTTQNASEIAIRKVNGATKGDIMRRCMAEGMILMAIAVIISLPIDYWLYSYAFEHIEELELNINSKCSLYAVGAAAVCMAVVVALAIWLPARRAMKVDPAIALKSE